MGTLVFLQPATLEYMRDVVIDDTRARNVLGYDILLTLSHRSCAHPCISRYRPQWTAAQSIRYSVEQVQSGVVSATHGIQVK